MTPETNDRPPIASRNLYSPIASDSDSEEVVKEPTKEVIADTRDIHSEPHRN